MINPEPWLITAYILTRILYLGGLVVFGALRVWRGQWHNETEPMFGTMLTAVPLLIPMVGDGFCFIFLLSEAESKLKAVSKHRALQIHAEASRQHPAAGQVTIVERQE
jgi:hypothetical protein